jgi:hypothetical protein
MIKIAVLTLIKLVTRICAAPIHGHVKGSMPHGSCEFESRLEHEYFSRGAYLALILLVRSKREEWDGRAI